MFWDHFKLEQGEFAINGTRHLSIVTHGYNKAIDMGWCVRDNDFHQSSPMVRSMQCGVTVICWYESLIYGSNT